MPSILSFCDSGCWRHQLSWVRCSVSHHLGWSRELLSPSCFPFPLCCYASGSLHQVNVDWQNLKSQVCTGCIWLILGSRNLSWSPWVLWSEESPWVLWSDEENVNMLDGCHHVYLDMGTNTGVQIRFNILGIDSWVYTNKGSSRYGCIGYPFLSDDMQWSSYSQKRQEIYLTNWQHRRAAKICNGVKENHNLVFSSGNSMSHIYFPMHQFWRSSRSTLVILNTGTFFSFMSL